MTAFEADPNREQKLQDIYDTASILTDTWKPRKTEHYRIYARHFGYWPDLAHEILHMQWPSLVQKEWLDHMKEKFPEINPLSPDVVPKDAWGLYTKLFEANPYKNISPREVGHLWLNAQGQNNQGLAQLILKIRCTPEEG